jgi:hypothetical protein
VQQYLSGKNYEYGLEAFIAKSLAIFYNLMQSNGLNDASVFDCLFDKLNCLDTAKSWPRALILLSSLLIHNKSFLSLNQKCLVNVLKFCETTISNSSEISDIDKCLDLVDLLSLSVDFLFSYCNLDSISDYLSCYRVVRCFHLCSKHTKFTKEIDILKFISIKLERPNDLPTDT